MKTLLENNKVLGVARPKRLELPQWIQQQTKIQAIETAAMAEEQSIRFITLSGCNWPKFALCSTCKRMSEVHSEAVIHYAVSLSDIRLAR